MSVASTSKTATSSGFYVTVATPKGTTTKRIEGDVMSVGRASSCNLSIPHETLSRRHMTVQLKDGLCYVEDHGSSNGTFINAKRIKPHQPIRVLPEDAIQLGQSGVKINVSTELQMWKSDAPPVPKNDAGDAATPPVETIVTTTMTERRLQRLGEQSAEGKKLEDASQQAEQLVQEAQKRASALIQEAEVEAERRVQDIYRRAHETQAKIDEVYQRRMNEAYRAAEKMYQKSQGESEVILEDARQKSAEIRAQAEGFVMELRRRTEEDCERILDEAQQTARELKENRLLEAEDMIRKKEQDIVNSTRETMNVRLARFEDDLLKETARHREVLEAELKDRKAQFEVDHKEQIQTLKTLKAETKQLSEQREREQEKLKSLVNGVNQKTAQNKSLQDQLSSSKDELTHLTGAVERVRAELSQIGQARDEGKTELEKIQIAQGQMDDELLRMREKFEEAKASLQKEESKHLEELKLETARKVRDLEVQMLGELSDKKVRLSRELTLSVETFLKKDGKTSRQNLSGLEDVFAKTMDDQIATLSNDDGAKQKERSLASLKRREKLKAVSMGLTLGVVFAFIGMNVHRQMDNNPSPIQRKVAAVTEQRKVDLENRKFNPPKSRELRATYADSVIYTEGFSKTYLDDEFQTKFRKAVSPYLLKTWRVEEEKVIELLAVATTLVKNLNERKENIHPDFVPQGLDKMKDLEKESVARMSKILGSKVRVESFRKFERKFFEGYKQ